MKLLYKFYSRYLLWKKRFKLGYYQHRYHSQLVLTTDVDIDASVQFLLQTSDSHLFFGEGTIVRGHCSFLLTDKAEIKIGKHVFFNRHCSLNALQSIEIGDNTILGENVKIYDHNHLFRDRHKLVKDQGYKTSAVTIGSNCWIGSDCIILPGVVIGDNSVIGAGNLVHKSMPPHSLVVSKREVRQETLLSDDISLHE